MSAELEYEALPVPPGPLPVEGKFPAEAGGLTWSEFYARATLTHHQAVLEKEKTRSGERPLPDKVPKPEGQPVTIGIIGAGVAGLYAAHMLDFLKDPDFTYEILEANSERIGGRLYTHYFNEKAQNDYFDIGAMRFPDIPFMERVFKLMKDLGLGDKMIKYILSENNNLNYFNRILLTNEQLDQSGADPFQTHVPGLTASASEMAGAQLDPFKEALASDFVTGWKELMRFDKYSTRTFMTLEGQKKPREKEKQLHGTDAKGPGTYGDQVVTYLETFQTSTNLYDCALSESVMDSLDFDYPGKQVNWYCIQDGADQITTRMYDRTQGPVHKGKRVKRIAFNSDASAVLVSVAGESTPRSYNHVISTLPFGCLRQVDMSECPLPWALQTAIRTLHYDSSVKVGIQFKERWWEQAGPNLAQKGGVTSTDLPTRVVVYPSYGIGQDTGATMIVSYTWAQDAARVGALCQGKNSAEEKLLVDLILGDLAKIHNLDKDYLRELYVTHLAYDWYNDPNAAGAFALFTPGQFKNSFSEVTKPLAGLLHFAGEACSVHHAWVIGAIDSAYRCLLEVFEYYKREDLKKKLEDEFGKLLEITPDLLEKQVIEGRRNGPARV